MTAEVARRRLPYPYRGMLAICSDLDETADLQTYLETARFLNTTAITRYGSGLGLEVGNTIYFDMPPGQFSYWNTDEQGRNSVRALIRSGHVDCLHSFGDLADTRAHAGRALDDLDRHGCSLRVWIDHAVAPSNFGADIMRGRGDVPGAREYHADLSCAFGIRYVWRGRVTSVIGQGVPRRLGGIANAAHPAASARTWAKEAAKGLLARRGDPKYRLHALNPVLTPATLRSGHAVSEFLRANPHWGGVSRGETARGIGEVLTEDMLTRLVAREGSCILYTHLGKTATATSPFRPDGIAALRRLAEYQNDGRVLVTTTNRVLGYTHAVEQIRLSTSVSGDVLLLDVEVPGGREQLADLQGLTFYVPDPSRTRLRLNGCEVVRLQHNPADDTGRRSVTVPWRRLEFPEC